MNLGPFRLHERIGEGGMGAVWRAVHTRTGVEAAIKVIAQAADPERVAAFEAEVRSIAQLDHPRIVRVYDYGTVPRGAEVDGFRPGSPFLAMELVRGSVADIELPAGWFRMRQVVLEVLDALARAHARDIVHRDIKPSNVLGRSGHLRLADFGIAHAVATPKDVSRSGTPYFMAPELFGDVGLIGPQTDLYAVGCMAYLLLRGSYPFDGNNAVAVATQHLLSPFPLENIEPPLQGWFARMTAKDPRDRFAFAADAAQALLQVDTESVVAAGPRIEDGAAPPLPAISASQTLPLFTLDNSVGVGVDPNRRDHRVPSDHDTVVDPPALQHLSRADPPTIEDLPRMATAPRTGFSDGHRWREATSDPSGGFDPLWGTGLRLFGLRAHALVGRDDARAAIWTALMRALETKRSHAIFLRGPQGVGKATLATWLSERAYEKGLAENVRFPADADPLRAAGELALRRFRRETPEELVDVLGGSLDDDERAALLTVARAAIRRGPGPQNLAHRWQLLLWALRIWSVGRPLILRFENLLPDTLAWSFVEHIQVEGVGGLQGPPVVAVCTIAPHAKGPNADVVSPETTTSLSNPATTVEVGPLGPGEMNLVVRNLLPLESGLTARVVQAAEGIPAHAVTQISAWVERDVLELTADGYRLADDGPVSSELSDIWRSRLLEVVGADDALRGALHVAAAIGPRVSHQAWESVCRARGLELSPSWVTRLLDTGLAVGTAASWRLRSDALVAFLKSDAKRLGSWAQVNLACADCLAEGAPDQLGTFLEEAGELMAAARAYLAAAEATETVSDYITGTRLVAECVRVLDALSASDSLLAFRARLRHARLISLDRVSEATVAASSIAQTAAERAGDPDDPDASWYGIYAAATLILARMARKRVELHEASRLYARARDAFARLDDAIEVAGCEQGLGMCAAARGEYDAAKDHYESALRTLDGRDPLVAGWCANGLGDVVKYQHDLDGALRWYGVALRQFQEAGNLYGVMWCVHDIARVHRKRGDLDAALEGFSRTLRIARTLGQRIVAPRLNFAITRVQRGDFAAARALIVDVLDESRRRGVPGETGIAMLCLLPCLAHDGAWDAVAEYLNEGSALIGALVDPELAQMARVAENLAKLSGRVELAQKLDEFAARHEKQ